MLRPYMRPYPAATLGDNPRQSGVPGVLLHQGVGVDLPVRNRHENGSGRARARCLVLPAVSVLAEPDQVLSALRFARELEQALCEDGVGRDGAARLRRIENTSTQRVHEAEGRRRPCGPRQLRLGLDEINLAQPEPRVVVAVVLGDVSRIGGPLVDASTFPFGRLCDIGDGRGEDEGVPGPIVHEGARQYVALLANEEDVATLVSSATY